MTLKLEPVGNGIAVLYTTFVRFLETLSLLEYRSKSVMQSLRTFGSVYTLHLNLETNNGVAPL
jgi:hypothetical protein